MATNHHTIIFVPHARAKLRKFRISSRQLSVVAAMTLAVTVFSLFVTWSYFTTAFDRDRLESLRHENRSLERVNASFKESIEGLEQALGEYEDRTRKLAILAGIEGLSDAGEGGIGGLAPAQETPDEALDWLHQRVEHLDGTLNEVTEKLLERDRWISSMPSILPVRGIYTSAFGNRKDPITGGPAFHQGIDISAPPGAPVLASADGVVTRSGWNGGLGRAIFLSHGYGLSTRYGHLSKLAVEAGDTVQRGDVIGYVGNTGRSTGYHLHYEVRQEGRAVNPMGYILDSGYWR
ncbi:MAG: M23 family metallopeptidase [Acidobacteriota bacterium]